MMNNHLTATRSYGENHSQLSSIVLYEHPKEINSIFSHMSRQTLWWTGVLADFLLWNCSNNTRLFKGWSGRMLDRKLNWINCRVFFQNCLSMFLWRPLPASLWFETTWKQREIASLNCNSHWSGFWALVLGNGPSKNIHTIYNENLN